MEELLEELRKLLGLADDADAKAICAAITAAIDGRKALVATAKALGLAEDAEPSDIETAAATASAKAAADPDPAKYVKAEDYNKLALRVGELEDGSATTAATAAVDAAIAAGKLLPAQRDWALAYAKGDGAAFETFIAGQPVIVTPAGGGASPPPSAKGQPLSEDELAICRTLGLDPEAYKKSRDAEEAP